MKNISLMPWEARRRERRVASRAGQGGITLFVVVVIVLLSTLLAAWAFRSSMFNQFVVRNDADYQRAFDAAQTLLQDAELDIMRLDASGDPCRNAARTGDLCRATGAVYFPYERGDFAKELLRYLSAKSPSCEKGICLKRAGAQDFWNLKSELVKMKKAAGRYGQFTGAKHDVAGSNDQGLNTLLNWTPNQPEEGKAWYWVEVLPYAVSKGRSLLSGAASNPNTNSNRFAPEAHLPFVYRITVLVEGYQQGTRVVLQSVVSRQRLP